MPAVLTVIKVGGSLLRDAEDVLRVAAALVERRRASPLLVVASALEGVTDDLQRAALAALGSRPGSLERALHRLRTRHEEVAREVGGNGGALARIEGPLEAAEQLLRSIHDAGELSERTYARLLSSGERLSARLLAAALRAAGRDARSITSERLGLKAEGRPRAGVCDLPGSSAGLRRVRPELRDRVLVLTGFYGVDRDGGVVLFGRGGSDDTAGAVAAGLGATRLELWKDVAGFMSADPRHVGRARVVPELSFDEVAQLGDYGSSIVHRGCLEPLRGAAAEIRICSPGGTNGDGTRVLEARRPTGSRVMALAGRRGRAELSLALRPGERGLVGEIAAHLRATEIPLDWLTVSASELRFRLAEPDVARLQQAVESWAGPRLAVRRFASLIGAVGDGVANDAAINSGMLACLSALRVDGELEVRRSGSNGLSCRNVHQEDLVPALNALHERFFDAG